MCRSSCLSPHLLAPGLPVFSLQARDQMSRPLASAQEWTTSHHLGPLSWAQGRRPSALHIALHVGSMSPPSTPVLQPQVHVSSSMDRALAFSSPFSSGAGPCVWPKVRARGQTLATSPCSLPVPIRPTQAKFGGSTPPKRDRCQPARPEAVHPAGPAHPGGSRGPGCCAVLTCPVSTRAE